MSAESKTRKPIIIATILLVVGIAAVVLHQTNSLPSVASTQTNIKQTETAPLDDGELVLNEDTEDRQVAADSCWWPTCKASDCNSRGGQWPCVRKCQQIGAAACMAKGKCCKGAPPPPPPPKPVSKSSGSNCVKECLESECGYRCGAVVACFKACVGGADCSSKKCCGKVKPPPPPPPPGPIYTWWTIGGTTTDQWCTNNCPNSKNPHCGDGIWCCGGTTHTEAECKKIKADRERECGMHCYRNCFYLDHNGFCVGCPDPRLRPICKRKLW